MTAAHSQTRTGHVCMEYGVGVRSTEYLYGYDGWQGGIEDKMKRRERGHPHQDPGFLGVRDMERYHTPAPKGGWKIDSRFIQVWSGVVRLVPQASPFSKTHRAPATQPPWGQQSLQH